MNYITTINKLTNKDYFSKLINNHQLYVEKRSNRIAAQGKVMKAGMIVVSAAGFIAAIMFKNHMIALNVLFVELVGLMALMLGSIFYKTTECMLIEKLEQDFANDIMSNSELLLALEPLAVGSEGKRYFNVLLDSSMKNKLDKYAIHRLYSLLENYEKYTDTTTEESDMLRQRYLQELKKEKPSQDNQRAESKEEKTLIMKML